MSKKTYVNAEVKKKKKHTEQKHEHGESQHGKTSSKEKSESIDISADEELTGSGGTAHSSEAIAALEQKIEDLTEKAADWQDKYIRLSAEFDNYRKRTLKEKSDLIRIANEDLLKDILPVVDDFERGIDFVDKSQDLEALRTGIHLIYNKFAEFLKQEGLKEIPSKEQVFDLDFHEALTKIPAPNEELKGKVVDVIEKGYTLNDKVIRYAKVVVGE
jgi:molecular chaperone GrpE